MPAASFPDSARQSGGHAGRDCLSVAGIIRFPQFRVRALKPSTIWKPKQDEPFSISEEEIAQLPGHQSVDIRHPTENKENKVAELKLILLTMFFSQGDNLLDGSTNNYSLGYPTRTVAVRCCGRRFRMAPKTQQLLHPYMVNIETPTGKSAALPVTLLTPKQAEDIQAEFKRLAQDAGVKGARINVQRVTADDYEKVIHEAKACLRDAVARAA
jgi:hypothetical protein